MKTPVKTIVPLTLVACAVLAFSGLGYSQTGGPSMGNLQPRAAEIAPLAVKNLLLGITKAGEQLVAVGDRGTILLSTDGEKWEQVAVPVNATLTAVSFADAQNGWVVGHDSTILHTTDSGRSWKLQNFDPKHSKPLLGVLALDTKRAYAVGAYGTFLETSDAGATWSAVVAPAILEEGLHLNALIRLNSGDLFLVGETGFLGVQEGGQTWRRLKLPYDGSLFGGLPRGDRGALVFGLRGNAFVTADVRSNQWTRVDTGTLQSLFAATALPDGVSLLVGADGALLKVGTDNKVRSLAASENKTQTAASYAAVLPWKNQLLVISELGVGHVANPAK